MNRFASLFQSLGRGVAVLYPRCRQVARLQSDALDRKLPLLRRFGLRLHLLLCKWCRRYGKQLRFLHEAAHERPGRLVEPQPDKMTDEARERIKRMMKADHE